MKLEKPVTLSQIADILKAKFIGDPDHIVSGINEIHMVEEGDLTFVDVKKYYKTALSSAATTILINQEIEPPAGKGLVIVDEPFTAFNQLGEYFQPSLPVSTEGKPRLGAGVSLGRNVVFGENVVIGDGTEIGHNVVIGSNVTIGAQCRIYHNVTINDHVVVGNHVVLNAGVVLGGEALYFKSRPETKEKLLTKGRVVIHDHVDIGANTTIDRGVTGDTIIGEYTKLDNLIMIGHDVQIGKRCILAGQAGIAGTVVIEDDCYLWGKAGASKDAHLSKGTVLNMSAIAIGKTEPGKSYVGIYAKPRMQFFREDIAVSKLPQYLKLLDKLLKEEEEKD